MPKNIKILGIISSALSVLICLFYSQLLYVVSGANPIFGLGIFIITIALGYKIFSIYPTFRKKWKNISDEELNKKLNARVGLNIIGILLGFFLIAMFSVQGDYLATDTGGVIMAWGLSLVIHIILLIILLRFGKLLNIPNTKENQKRTVNWEKIKKMHKIRLTSNEIIIISTILGSLIFGLLGWFFGSKEHNAILGREEFIFNYIAAFIGFIVTAGLTYLVLNRFTLKENSKNENN